MDEVVFYVTAGDPADKHSQESLGSVASIHTSKHYTSFRNADCPRYGAALTGIGSHHRVFVAAPGKSLLNCYSWGKEGVDQRFPVPEEMSCLAIAQHPVSSPDQQQLETPDYQVPWLLAAGAKSGRIYIWELASGNLVCVREAHYQQVGVLKFSKCGTFLVSGGDDSRVMVWRTMDLVGPEPAQARAHAVFTHHTLAVTDIAIAESGSAADIQVLSASKDGTVRSYHVLSKQLLSTFVFSHPVECLARDPAGRALYVGLANGDIRAVPMYEVNAHSHVLEAVGGAGRIVTVQEDPELRQTFVQHSDGSVPSLIAVSMDGMCIVLADRAGQVYVADVVTRQVCRLYSPCKSAIAYLEVGVVPSQALEPAAFDKKHRLLPALKRILVAESTTDRTVTVQVAGLKERETEFDSWLEQKRNEAISFETPAAADTVMAEKLDRVSEAYSKLRTMYEELASQQ